MSIKTIVTILTIALGSATAAGLAAPAKAENVPGWTTYTLAEV
jgi:hypothetical protein